MSEDLSNKLSHIMGKKIETTFIGAIDSFEKYFGYLWGIDKDEEELTEDEIKMDELWQECRIEILNKGNKQRRGAEKEINNYSISRLHYHYQFIPRAKREGYNG
jgi:hypothetical protein